MSVSFFFFQAEDGIRDKLVTGVQTCALPIFALREPAHGVAEQLLLLGELRERGYRRDLRHRSANLAHRSFNRRTNLRPDHTSSTAATFTSTRPCASPMARITFSVRSVGTPDALLGHEIHNMPAGASARTSTGKRRSSSCFSCVKN